MFFNLAAWCQQITLPEILSMFLLQNFMIIDIVLILVEVVPEVVKFRRQTVWLDPNVTSRR